MISKKTDKTAETDEQYSHRIRTEAREKMLKCGSPVDLEALRRSMEFEEPTHLGDLSKRPNADEEANPPE